jgi:hypothetical protein
LLLRKEFDDAMRFLRTSSRSAVHGGGVGGVQVRKPPTLSLWLILWRKNRVRERGTAARWWGERKK